MKKKTIAKVLDAKLKEFAASITDETVRGLVLRNTIVTGGSIANMLVGEPVNDYDMYFTDKETVLAVANYYCEVARKAKVANMFTLHIDSPEVQSILKANVPDLHRKVNEEIKHREIVEDLTLSYEDAAEEFNCLREFHGFNSGGVPLSWRLIRSIYETFEFDEEDRVKIYSSGSWGVNGIIEDVDHHSIDSQDFLDEEDGKYEVKFISANAITLSDKTQLIIRFYGDAAEIHKNFDYVHATSYWTSKEKRVITNTEALESLLSKHLIYRGSKYPLASIFRARKFIYRGWRIDAGQYLKMVFQLNDMDLTDPYTLEEQLTGVDLLYFNEIINNLKQHQMRDENFSYGTEEMIKIVEKIFE